MTKKITAVLLLVLLSSPAMATSTHDFFGPVTRYQLPNGLTVLLKPVDRAHSVSTQIWIRAGSLYEDDTNNGLSHLLEHMLFKGTEKYSGHEINTMIENVGGRQNAGTSKDYTNYHVTLPADHWKRSLQLLEQMAFHASFPEDEFTKERRVVLSELARYQDNPRRLLWLRFVPQLYEDHPYERVTIGSREVLENVTHDQLVAYYDRFYVPSRALLVMAGNFEVERARTVIQELFADESSVPFDRPSFPAVEPPQSDTIVRETRDVNQVYGMIGTTGVSLDSGQSIALDVLMEVFGKGKTSRLYENLVLRESLATSLSASFWTQQETGPVMVRFQTTNDKLDGLLEGIRSQAQTLAEEGISPEEFERAKTQIKTSFIYDAQTPNSQARQLGYWETLASVKYLESYLDRLESLERESVNELAKRILQRQNWTGTVFVPNN